MPCLYANSWKSNTCYTAPPEIIKLIKLSSAPEALLQVSFGQQQNSQRWAKKFNYPSHISPRMPPWRKLNVDLPIRLALQLNVIVLHNWMSGKTTGQTEAGCLVWTVLTQDVEKIRQSEAGVKMDIQSVDNLLKKNILGLDNR